jgi:hypothetical protein
MGRMNPEVNIYNDPVVRVSADPDNIILRIGDDVTYHDTIVGVLKEIKSYYMKASLKSVGPLSDLIEAARRADKKVDLYNSGVNLVVDRLTKELQEALSKIAALEARVAAVLAKSSVGGASLSSQPSDNVAVSGITKVIPEAPGEAPLPL